MVAMYYPKFGVSSEERIDTMSAVHERSIFIDFDITFSVVDTLAAFQTCDQTERLKLKGICAR